MCSTHWLNPVKWQFLPNVIWTHLYHQNFWYKTKWDCIDINLVVLRNGHCGCAWMDGSPIELAHLNAAAITSALLPLRLARIFAARGFVAVKSANNTSKAGLNVISWFERGWILLTLFYFYKRKGHANFLHHCHTFVDTSSSSPLLSPPRCMSS